MRGVSDGMKADQGVAVAAFVSDGEVWEVQRGAAVALGDHEAAGGHHGGQGLRQLPAERRRVPVWRIQENEIVLAPGRRRVPEKPPGVAPRYFCTLDALQIAADGLDRRRRVVDEGGARGATRQGFDPERTAAGEQ